jgi:hypothetical protein
VDGRDGIKQINQSKKRSLSKTVTLNILIEYVIVELTPCQVPRARRPFVMGMFRDTPMRLDFTCPGISDGAAK